MLTDKTALVVIDLQEAMRADRDAGYPWANPDAPATAGRLLAAFRGAGLPVVHIHHHGTDPADGFHPDNTLSRAMPEVAPQPGEPVVVKLGSSGFIGTGLEVLLREAGFDHLVIVGGEANMCVESTTRMAGNMGFRTTVVADALVNFQRTRRDGVVVPPREVLEMSLANMTSFATVVESRSLLDELAQAAQ
ncbi:MAG: cysteine hydrolase [Pseudorhodobacter sp.]|nr:cysteine hydrolase [Pseudorhodobacter sp.]